MMTEEQIIEAAIQGHASTRDAIRWAMNQVRKDAEPVAWMGVDSEGNPNKFRLNFFGGSIPLFTTTEDMKLIETREKHGSPCPEFWDWLPKSYNFDGDGSFTKYNMEVAFLAGKNSTPNHAPAAVRQLVEALRMVMDDPDALDGRPRTYERVQEALAAAKEARL